MKGEGGTSMVVVDTEKLTSACMRRNIESLSRILAILI